MGKSNMGRFFELSSEYGQFLEIENMGIWNMGPFLKIQKYG